jgi:hypothetical protein
MLFKRSLYFGEHKMHTVKKSSVVSDNIGHKADE